MKIAILTDEPRAHYLPGEEGLSEDLQKQRTIKDLKKCFQNDLSVYP